MCKNTRLQTTSNDSFYDDFIDFKETIWTEVAKLKCEIGSERNTCRCNPDLPAETASKALYEKIISSLEKQLDEKQRIFESLLSQDHLPPRNYPPSTRCHSPPLMEISQSVNNTKESEYFSIEIESKTAKENSNGEKKKKKKKNKKNNESKKEPAISSNSKNMSLSEPMPTPNPINIVPTGSVTASNPKNMVTNESGIASNPIDLVPSEPESASNQKEAPDEPSTSSNSAAIKHHTKNTQRNNRNDRMNITIIGDSLLKGIEQNGLSRKHNIRVRSHPGANSTDITDHIKPALRRKPDGVVLHHGTNDITEDMDTCKILKETIETIRKESPQTVICVSALITRNDKPGLAAKVEDTNRRLKALCIEEKIEMIDNSNIDESCLNHGKLLLNRKGNALFARNLLNYINNF